MYEAPDRYKRMVSARLPGGESLGLSTQDDSDTASPLRDAQLLARAQLAPFFAAANIVAALLIAGSLLVKLPSTTLFIWVGSVVTINLGALHVARTQAITHVGRSGRKVPQWLLVGEVVLRAAVWLSLPLYYFPALDPASQLSPLP